MIFGHHFTSIAGTGPIVGPALAVIWGWVPALIWVLIGWIFIGALHDFGSLCRKHAEPRPLFSDLAGRVLAPRTRILFSRDPLSFTVDCAGDLWSSHRGGFQTIPCLDFPLPLPDSAGHFDRGLPPPPGSEHSDSVARCAGIDVPDRLLW